MTNFNGRFAFIGAIVTYVIQTNLLAKIQSKQFALHAAAVTSDIDGNLSSSDDDAAASLTVYLAFAYFAGWMLLFPLSNLIKDDNNITLRDSNSFPLSRLNSENGMNSERIDTSTNVPSILITSAPSRDPNNSIDSLHPLPLPALTHSSTEDSYSSMTNHDVLVYVFKLFVLSICCIIPITAYIYSLSLCPVFDVVLMQRVSIFEISMLLFGIIEVQKHSWAHSRKIFQSYILMLISLFGTLLISYSRASSDLASGKIKINSETGELADPFLFDRLKGYLIVGLCSLPIGLFNILWHHWFQIPSSSIRRQAHHLSCIGLISIICLLPFFPHIPFWGSPISSLLYSVKGFWIPLILAIGLGTLPHSLFLLYLHQYNKPQYVLTTSLFYIVTMSILEWLNGRATDLGEFSGLLMVIFGGLVLAKKTYA